MNERQVLRLFGIQEDTVRERLADVLSSDKLMVVLSIQDADAVLELSSTDEAALAWATGEVEQRLGAYLYSTDEKTLEQQAVARLSELGKTVAVAESCTGGLVASRLTNVPGCSAVFGTGVVSYSWDCKKQLLGVSSDTLETFGAVSAETAREMANGIRQQAGADIGIATTGEAGPQAAEDKPVGTVFVALADAKRTWVKELHLDSPQKDRAAIRREAAGYALDVLQRYLRAYPMVMAGGERHADYAERQRELSADSEKRRRFSWLPWRGSRKKRTLKITACLAALTVLVVGILTMYNRIVMPIKNRTLQEDLADLYWNNTADLTVDDDLGEQYPSGMTAQFRGLYDINEDIGGWVYIPETKVNYAVTLQANGYYNNHSFNNNYSVYGQPYFCENTERESLKNERVLAIWGNNTHDEQMFSSLLSYRRIAYLRENPIVVMNTLYTAARWEIFAVMVVDERERASEFEYIQREFEDDEAFMYYIRQLQRRSLFRSSTAVTAEDSVLLLVTNAEREYGFTGARLVIAARRIADEQAVSTYTINNDVKWPDAYAPYTTTHPTTSTTTVPSTTTSTSGVTSGGETTTQTTTSSTSSVTESTTVPSDGSTTKPSSDEDTSNMGRMNDDHLGN